LAVVLIVGGALVAGLLVIQQGHKSGAIEVTQTIGQGQRIPPGALQEIQVTTGLGIDYVPWDEASQVTRTYAATTIPAGTLLTPQMTVATNTLATGLTQVGLALKDGQMPDGLQIGDRVDVYAVSDSAGQCPEPANFILTTNAVVLSIQRPLDNSSSAAFDVQIGVSPGDVGGVTCNAANGNVSVGIVPSGQGATSAGGQPAATPGNPSTKHPGTAITSPAGGHATTSQSTGGPG
jgi:Flp pilus assembly protein CpaB